MCEFYKLHHFFPLNSIFFYQPIIVNSYEIGERFVDEILPTDEEEGSNNFSSMELTASNTLPKKREARPIIGLIMDILDTMYKSTKSDLKRSQAKGSRFTQ